MNSEKVKKLEILMAKEYFNIAGVVVQKNGKMCYEYYQNNISCKSPVHIYSVTKSVVSILIGIAIDKGYIKSVNQEILDFFPAYESKDNFTKTVVIKDMLTMTLPYKFEEANAPYEAYFSSDNWAFTSLDLLGGSQKGVFRYAPIIGPDILTGILVKATGKSVLDFAQEHLFSPLGITVKETITFQNQEEQMTYYQKRELSGWVADPQGVNTAGWGLSLTTKDMAKLGQLYNNNGLWENKRIVSSSWIKESTAAHSHFQEANLDYGYLWWVLGEGQFAAMGDGGNTIFVDRKKDITVAVTAYLTPNAKDTISFIQTQILPALEE